MSILEELKKDPRSYTVKGLFAAITGGAIPEAASNLGANAYDAIANSITRGNNLGAHFFLDGLCAVTSAVLILTMVAAYRSSKKREEPHPAFTTTTVSTTETMRQPLLTVPSDQTYRVQQHSNQTTTTTASTSGPGFGRV